MIKSKLFFLSFVTFMFIILFGACKSVKVENNERGVIFKKFGSGIDTSKVYLPGKYNIAKHDGFIIYNIDSKLGENIIKVRLKDYTKVEVTVAYSFKPMPEKVALLHRYTGADFKGLLVEPAIYHAVKEYLKSFEEVDIFLYGKETIGEEIFQMAEKTIEKGHVKLESILIKNIIIH